MKYNNEGRHLLAEADFRASIMPMRILIPAQHRERIGGRRPSPGPGKLGIVSGHKIGRDATQLGCLFAGCLY